MRLKIIIFLSNTNSTLVEVHMNPRGTYILVAIKMKQRASFVVPPYLALHAWSFSIGFHHTLNSRWSTWSEWNLEWEDVGSNPSTNTCTCVTSTCLPLQFRFLNISNYSRRKLCPLLLCSNLKHQNTITMKKH